MIVDSHSHASPYWFEPVEALVFHMDMAGVDKAVLVQIIGQYENSYLFECVRKYPGRIVPVVMLDHEDPGALQKLRAYASQGATGVRLKAKSRSPGTPYSIWQEAGRLGLPVSCLAWEDEAGSDEFAELAASVPETTIVVEHLGLPSRDEPKPYDAFKKVLRLSRYPNVYMKVGGLGEICNRPYPFIQPMPFLSIPPFVNMAYDAFGPRRLMWGSDFPPVSFREGYSHALGWLRSHLDFCSEQDRSWILGGTAASVFAVPGEPGAGRKEGGPKNGL